jgi:hypothetical protein
MKKVIMTILLVAVLAVIAFGYVSTPVVTIPPSETGHPNVMGKITVYIGNDASFMISVDDSNDDPLTVTAVGGIATKNTTMVTDWNGRHVGYVGDVTVTDANGTYVFHINNTIYNLNFHPTMEGYSYPEIVVTDSHGLRDIKYVEIYAQKKNIAPVITGCRVN